MAAPRCRLVRADWDSTVFSPYRRVYGVGLLVLLWGVDMVSLPFCLAIATSNPRWHSMDSISFAKDFDRPDWRARPHLCPSDCHASDALVISIAVF